MIDCFVTFELQGVPGDVGLPGQSGERGIPVSYVLYMYNVTSPMPRAGILCRASETITKFITSQYNFGRSVKYVVYPDYRLIGQLVDNRLIFVCKLMTDY